MTTPADDAAVEDAFEAYLAGRPVPDEAADLAAFSEAVRASAIRPGRPDAALAELLATGLLIDQSSPSARTARAAGAPPSRGTRTRNRRRFAMFIPVLIAKFLSAGAVAQAATGAGLVLVVATGAGATGVLGDDVQETVASVVGVASEEATGDDVVALEDVVPGTGIVVEPTPVVQTTAPAEPTEAEFDAATWAADGPTEDQPFGQWVSVAAHNKDAIRAAGLSFGQMVREWAHQKGLDDAELVEEGVDLDELVDVPAEPTPTTAPEVEADTAESEPATATTERSNRGNGNAGNGKATNGGNAGNGKATADGGNAGGDKGNGRN